MMLRFICSLFQVHLFLKKIHLCKQKFGVVCLLQCGPIFFPKSRSSLFLSLVIELYFSDCIVCKFSPTEDSSAVRSNWVISLWVHPVVNLLCFFGKNKSDAKTNWTEVFLTLLTEIRAEQKRRHLWGRCSTFPAQIRLKSSRDAWKFWMHLMQSTDVDRSLLTRFDDKAAASSSKIEVIHFS